MVAVKLRISVSKSADILRPFDFYNPFQTGLFSVLKGRGGGGEGFCRRPLSLLPPGLNRVKQEHISRWTFLFSNTFSIFLFLFLFLFFHVPTLSIVQRPNMKYVHLEYSTDFITQTH